MSLVETTWPAALAASFFFIFGVSSSRNFCMAALTSVSSSVRLVASVATVPLLGRAAGAGGGRIELALDDVDLGLGGGVGGARVIGPDRDGLVRAGAVLPVHRLVRQRTDDAVRIQPVRRLELVDRLAHGRVVDAGLGERGAGGADRVQPLLRLGDVRLRCLRAGPRSGLPHPWRPTPAGGRPLRRRGRCRSGSDEGRHGGVAGDPLQLGDVGGVSAVGRARTDRDVAPVGGGWGSSHGTDRRLLVQPPVECLIRITHLTQSDPRAATPAGRKGQSRCPIGTSRADPGFLHTGWT